MDTNKNTNQHKTLLYKELSYQIQGAAIEVRKNFGPGLKESIYQNAFAEELKSRNIKFEKEKSIQIFSPKTGKLVGSYRPDFIIDDKVLVELKAVEKIPKLFIDQLYSYLRNSKYELGYFINFASPKLYIKRIIYTNDRKFLKFKNLLVFISFILVSISVFIIPSAQAAEIFFGTDSLAITQGSTFEVGVLANTAGQSINALEGNIVFPADFLTLRTIQDGNSIINLWLLRPQIAAGSAGDKISFAGIIPGGYTGDKGYLFSLIFTAKKSGEVKISMSDEKLLLNDGQGTAAGVTKAPLTLKINSTGKVQDFFQPYDQEPPESFTPLLARDPELFNNQWFLVFATQDKLSGIKWYEVKEEKKLGWLNFFWGQKNWRIAESPYLLLDQKLQSHIYVKAVDNAGNERVTMVLPANPLSWYENYVIWSIIILVLITGFLLVILSKNKKHKDKNGGKKSKK